MKFKIKSLVSVASIAGALLSSAFASAQTATPLPGSVLVDQAAVKTAVAQVQGSLSKALQDAMSLQANSTGVMNMVYQASLAVSVAKLSSDGATLAQATQKLNTDAAPILAANNKALQDANQRLQAETKAGNASAIAKAKAAVEKATKQASVDQAAIFGALSPNVTEKVQASISRVLRNALKLGADIVANKTSEVAADKLALSADFATLVTDAAAMSPTAVKPVDDQALRQAAAVADKALAAAANMSQANKDKLTAFANQTSAAVANVSQADKDKLAALAKQAGTAASNMSQANKDKLTAFANQVMKRPTN